MIVSCRRSELAERAATAGGATSPRAGRFSVTSSAGPVLTLAMSCGAIDRSSGSGCAGLAASLTVDDLLGGLCAAKLGHERFGCRIGLSVQLALEQRNEVLVVLERF